MDPKLLGAIGGIALVAILLWPSGSSKRVERLYNEGEQLYGQSEYEEAVSKYTEALKNRRNGALRQRLLIKIFRPWRNTKSLYATQN